MAKVLQSFLIGVGLDTEDYDAGAKKVESSLGRMRSLVGLTGAAITGAFAAAGTAAVVAGRRVDQFGLATEGLKTSRQYIADYGRALAALGGNADDAIAAIKSIETAQSNFRIKGMLGPLEDVALTGADITQLSQTTTGKDFLRTLAPMVQGMNKDQQRQVQDALGLSDAVMRSLRGGLEAFDASIQRAHDLAGNLDQATEAARDFNEQLSEFETRMEGVGNTLAAKVLPGFTGILQSLGGFIDGHQDLISKAADVAGENPGATALLVGGGAAAGGGVMLRGIAPGAMGAAGARIARLGTWGAVAGAGLIAGDLAVNGMTDEQRKRMTEGGSLVPFGPEGAPFYPLGDPDRTPDAPLGSAVPDVPPGSIVPRDPVYSGGEVSPAEAAATSPSVIMLRDQQNRLDVPAVTPRVSVDNHIDMTVQLDGRQMESKITDVIQRRERDTRDDITSSVDR
jgi:hypothetical protein